MRRWGALLALAVSAMCAVPATVAAAEPPRPLLLIAVPDLRWDDLAAMPVLRAFTSYVSVGVMSVRAEGEATRCGDGLLELSAGTRVPTGVRTCGVGASTLARLRARYRHDRFGSHVGALGDGLGVPVAAVGPGAAALLTDSRGRAVPGAPSVEAAFAGATTACVAVVDDGLYGATDRRRAAAAVDALIAEQFRQTPQGAEVVIAGISDGPTGGPHLHPLLVAAPGFAHRELTSPTTGRAPYVQLFDLTATLLALRGQTSLPSYVSGRQVRVTDRVVPPPSSYADLDRHARRALGVGHPTFSVLCGVLLGVLLLAAAGRREASWLARLLVLAPLGPTVLQLVPWWRWTLAVYVAGVVIVAVFGAVVVSLLANRWPRAALIAGPTVLAAVLLLDQLAGAPLQLSAPFGDNPLVAGRFRGMGNIDFGLTMAGLLLVAAVVASTQASRRRAALFAAAICAVGVVVDGAPSLGNDIGGLIALLPAAALLVALVSGAALTVRRLAAVVVAGVALAVAVALLDFARPAGSQTHAGRFVGEVLHGDAWQVVHRKLDAVLASFDNPVVTAVVIAAVIAAVLWRRQRLLPGVARAAVPVGVLALLGSALNDSGIFVAAAAALATVPSVLAVGRLGPDTGDTRTL